MRKEVAAACGPALDLKVDVPSFVTHKLPYGMRPIGEQEVIRTYTSLVPYIVELCQLEPAMAKRVTAVVLRSSDVVEGGTLDYGTVYVDRRSVGSRYVVGGKAALRGSNGTFMFEAGVLSVYTGAGDRFGPMFSEFTKERDRERPNFLRAIPGLGIGAGTALNVADRDRSKSKLGPGCVAVDGEEICGSGSLGFAEAVESGDCNQSDSPRTTIACRKRLAAVKELAIDCKIGKTYQALVNEGESERHIPNAVFEQILKKLPSCPNGGNILVDVLYTRWDYSSQSFKMRLEESERALVSKLNKAVMTACSALRPTVADRDVLSPENRESTVLTEFLYRCAVVAGGSLSPYSWKTKAADIALLRREQSDRRAADAETRAENAARPSAAAFCSGHITAKCMSRCIKAKLCR